MRTNPTRMLVLGVAFVVCSCEGGGTSNTSSSPANGGSAGSGGTSTIAAGGSSSSSGGGVTKPTGGSATGGVATANSSGGNSSGGNSSGGNSSGGNSSSSAASTTQHEAFELGGRWLFLGPGDVMHRLQITDESMVYTDIDGNWTSTWTIQRYDNSLHQFQLVFGSGTGTYYPHGESFSGTYVVNGAILTAQLADGLGTYPPMLSPGSCTDGDSNPLADCGLYMSER
ncbi:MAG TPA: hypothetical protein VIV60_20440 [Polyangiaceae bacterium]